MNWNQVLLAVQHGVYLACVFTSLIVIAAYLFPSLRGPRWVNSDLLLAIVFLLLAIAVRPR